MTLSVQQIFRLARLFRADDHEPGGRRYYQHAYELIQTSRGEYPARAEEAESLISQYIEENAAMSHAINCVYRVLDDGPSSVALDPAHPSKIDIITIGELVTSAYGAFRTPARRQAFDAWSETEEGRWAMMAYDAPRGD